LRSRLESPPGQGSDAVAGEANATPSVGAFLDHGLLVESRAAGRIGILLLDCELPVWVSLVHDNAVLATQRAGRGQDDVCNQPREGILGTRAGPPCWCSPSGLSHVRLSLSLSLLQPDVCAQLAAG
jgi:hypothetical protein